MATRQREYSCSTNKLTQFLFNHWQIHENANIYLPCEISVTRRLTKTGVPKISYITLIVKEEQVAISPEIENNLIKKYNLVTDKFLPELFVHIHYTAFNSCYKLVNIVEADHVPV